MTDHDDTIGPQLNACLDRLSAGDLAAHDTIIELCSGRLRTLASRMLSRFPNVSRWDDTDDVFQNAAMRLHRALGQMRIDSPRSIMALAATQLHRELIDLARRYSGPSSFAANHATNIQPLANSEVIRVPEPEDVETPADVLDRWTLFHEAIEGLPEQQREIFHLVWYLGGDQKTIARLLNCSERTVKSRWREAREAVRTTLDGHSPE
jgi:RNA polymerase sigma factor (sigma-70 family)